MNENYLLSICIPTFNRVEYLRKQVEYLISEGAYEDSRVQIIISDNHSDDGTQSYLEELSSKYPKIVYNRNETNIGLARNLFICSEMAHGRFFWILGDDDHVLVGTVRTVLNILEAHQEIGHLYLNYVEKSLNLADRVPYSGGGGEFNNGYEMFSHITQLSKGFGNQMFITSNVFSMDLLRKANYFYKKGNLLDNLALPLGYSLFCSQKGGFIADGIFMTDNMNNNSWKSSKIRLFTRDMIEILDKTGEAIGRGDDIRKLIVQTYRGRCPEVDFLVRGRKYKTDNYAMNLYWKYFPGEVLLDFFRYPFFVMKNVFRKLKSFSIH